MIKHIKRLMPGGVTIECRQVQPDRQEFRKTIGNDSFSLSESDAGIYITVRTFRGEVCCTELLYGLGRDTHNFWLLSREWAGADFKPGTKFKRDSEYPVGKQVSLAKCFRTRENPKSSQSASTVSS